MGILHRMPKPGSFASITCTLSEHLRARPKHTPPSQGRRLTISGEAANRNPLAYNPKTDNCLYTRPLPREGAPARVGLAIGF